MQKTAAKKAQGSSAANEEQNSPANTADKFGYGHQRNFVGDMELLRTLSAKATGKAAVGLA